MPIITQTTKYVSSSLPSTSESLLVSATIASNTQLLYTMTFSIVNTFSSSFATQETEKLSFHFQALQDTPVDSFVKNEPVKMPGPPSFSQHCVALHFHSSLRSIFNSLSYWTLSYHHGSTLHYCTAVLHSPRARYLSDGLSTPWHDLDDCPPVGEPGALVRTLNRPPWPVAIATCPREDGLALIPNNLKCPNCDDCSFPRELIVDR